MKHTLKPSLGASFFALSLLLIVLAIFLQWKIIHGQQSGLSKQQDYEKKLLQYQQKNIFYRPQATSKWLATLQHPEGYFVASHERLYDLSQININTLSTTQYAISALEKLDSLHLINREAVIDYLSGLYVPAVVKMDSSQTGFRNLNNHPPTIKSSMDALIILKTLGALDDRHINLTAIKNFILSRQQSDGGFSESTSSDEQNRSSLSVTSYAARALDILQSHQHQKLNSEIQTAVQHFVSSTLDSETGGYADIPGETATDSHSTFNAFISLWNIAGGSQKARQKYVERYMKKKNLFWYLIDKHFLSGSGAFSRYHDAGMNPSLTATQKSVMLMQRLGLANQINAEQIGHYGITQQSTSGQFGEDILSSYSAIVLLQNLGAATKPLPKPAKPIAAPGIINQFLPALVFMLAFGPFTLGFMQKRKQLEALNKSLTQVANTDDLTGIYNRKYFEQAGYELIKSCHHKQRNLCLLSLCVDELDTINKTKGHLTGDSILEKLVELINPSLHESYIFARWGGGVFMILTPDTDHENASMIMKKTGMAIAKHNFGIKQILGCSIAVTELAEGDNIQKLTTRVDKILSQHKINKKKKATQVKAA